jgi:hypothetical protein
VCSRLQLAGASLHPEQAIWEPLLLGQPFNYTTDHEVKILPWRADIVLEGNTNDFVDSADISIFSESKHGRSVEPSTKAVGTGAIALLKESGSSFWDAEVRKNAAVVFKFSR